MLEIIQEVGKDLMYRGCRCSAELMPGAEPLAAGDRTQAEVRVRSKEKQQLHLGRRGATLGKAFPSVIRSSQNLPLLILEPVKVTVTLNRYDICN